MPAMFRLLLALLLLPLHASPPEPPRPATVAVIFNRSVEASEKLARTYAAAREIPTDNLVGLNLPDQESITREQYDTLIRDPLIAEFDRRKWWHRTPGPDGSLELRRSRIKILVCMRGVPLKITHPKPTNAEGKPVNPSKEQMVATRNAAVDSEMAMLGMESYQLDSALQNPYYEAEVPVSGAELQLLLVGRIDAHNFPTCERMIRDAIETEKTGLWGFAAVDVAEKVPEGDNWLRVAASQLDSMGIPTLLDRFPDTLPLNFPLPDTAYYLGWYDGAVSGPFKNPGFRFKPGAVAVHIHSFSAAQLRNPGGNWCAPILARGAAATLGNVHEPFLHLTHHLDIFTDRLLEGYTLIEAAYMSIPALSWQGIVLGDPLYRPFRHLDGTGQKAAADRAFRALRIASLRWTDTAERETQLRAAAARMEDPRFLEALGLHYHLAGQDDRAAMIFQDAIPRCRDHLDKLRLELHLARIDREAKRKELAIKQLRQSIAAHSDLPETKAAQAWLNILDPPPPPPAEPKPR